MRERSALECMLEPRSVAVVGASVKDGSLGLQMMLELERGGFDGAVFPVNPSYEDVLGRRCYASMADLPEAVDLAILGVANTRIERALRDAAEAGARSAVTFSSLFEEVTDERPPLTDRIAAIAREAGMALCGGNGMGLLNLEAGVRATGFATPDDVRPGPVAFISHSGSAFSALLYNDRGIGFNVVVSSGQELVTGLTEYMEYALDLPSTRVLALLIETVREPARFRAALELAAARDVAVVAMKVGRTEASKAMVTAHSGALAGEDGVFEALFDACGVLRVATLEDMADAIELLSCPRRSTTGSGIASIHDSGGERAMFADVAADLGVPFARIGEATISRIQAALDPGLEAANPLDAWGTGIDHERIFIECFRALHDDPETAALAFVVDLTRQGEPYAEGYLQIAKDVFASTTKPFCVLSNMPNAIAPEEAAILREAGIPLLEGTSSGLAALRLLLENGAFRTRPPLEPPAPVSASVRARWRDRLATGGEVGELEGLSLLADYGVPLVPAREASSADEAVAAAAGVGFPVALKTAAAGVHHKSDVDGVRLGLPDTAAVGEAYEDVSARLGPRVVVSAMVPAGVELAFGVVRDPQFGPLALVAAGGVLVELLGDRRLAFPPLDERSARRLIDGLAMRPLLDGARGSAPADVRALALALSRLSLLAADLGDLLEALDVNPVIASTTGCVAVDALVLPRHGAAGAVPPDVEPGG